MHPKRNDPHEQLARTQKNALLEQNINDLARVISSEARGVNLTEQEMVGWTIVNRMKQRHASRVSAVWHGYAHGHAPTQDSLTIARSILDGTARDISQGADHFYTPALMPKEGESTAGWDVGRDLEQVEGVTKDGHPVRNYRPVWAEKSQPIFIPNVHDEDFKFYKGR